MSSTECTEAVTEPTQEPIQLPPQPRFPDAVPQAPARARPQPSTTQRWWFLSTTATNFWLDALLLAAFLFEFWVSLVLRFAFPPGPAADEWTLWGYSYVTWSRIQFIVMCLFGGGVVLHLMLHWNWICSVVIKWLRRGRPARPAAKDDPRRTIWGVILLIAVLGAMGVGLGAAKLMIVSPYDG